MGSRTTAITIRLITAAILTAAGCGAPVGTTLRGLDPGADRACGPNELAALVPDCPSPGVCFTDACNAHNTCYSTCGVTRADCDRAFYSDMLDACTQIPFIGRDRFNECLTLAFIYWQSVELFGGNAFRATQQLHGCDLSDPTAVFGACCIPGEPPVCDDEGSLADCPALSMFYPGVTCGHLDETHGGCPDPCRTQCASPFLVDPDPPVRTEPRALYEPRAAPLDAAQKCQGQSERMNRPVQAASTNRRSPRPPSEPRTLPSEPRTSVRAVPRTPTTFEPSTEPRAPLLDASDREYQASARADFQTPTDAHQVRAASAKRADGPASTNRVGKAIEPTASAATGRLLPVTQVHVPARRDQASGRAKAPARTHPQVSITDQPIICDEIPLEDFPDFDTALAAWRNDAADRACIPHPTDGPPALIVGQCKTADLFFLLRSEGDTAEIRFYDTTTRQFTARIRTAPGSDPVCHGRTYWPNDPDCFTGTITETLCGPTLRPGTVIPLP